MTLLKGDGSLPPKTEPKVTITRWPTERWPEGLGVSVRDGWNFGIGFGLAMAIAVPFILILLSCVIGGALMILGMELGALL
jgi:hypothetical protein